jgi:hypothetical protein
MNRDLAEIWRFWPKAAKLDFCGPLYVARPVGRYNLDIAESFGGGWFLSDWRDGGPELSAVYRGSTIAAAMAAAGFGGRKKGLFADCRYLTAAVWIETAKRNPERFAGRSRIKPARGQRPRKGVRLGNKKRWEGCEREPPKPQRGGLYDYWMGPVGAWRQDRLEGGG